jgi:hypothetical protein
MKNFQQYLAESERTYNYRIKLVGDVPPDFLRELKDKCAQFDVVKWGDTKSTPVQLKPADFPQHENDRVTTVDVEFRYPAIEPQIKQLAQLLGFNPNSIIMQTPHYADSMQTEKEKVEEQNKDLLTDTDFPAPDAEQRALSKDYSADPYKHAVLKNAYKSDFTVAGGKTPPAVTTNDAPMNNAGPFIKVKRPPRPATGSTPRG